MIAHTRYGVVEGSAGGPVAAFKGIPFAAPPVGELRWRPPLPPAPWTGVRPALEYGPAAPQAHDAVAEEMLGQPPFPTSEESCLTLNVWTPATDDGARPVMVWVHGGAFLAGSGRDAVFDGSRLAARHDVVVVTINYRVGALGFLHLGDALGDGYAESGNLGLLDQVAALRWVGENIAAFGGDPGNVTVFGQSAGAMSIVSVMAMPAAAGLFHKAIVQSGSAELVRRPEHAAAVTREFLGVLGLREITARRLREVPVTDLISAQETVAAAMRARGEGVGLPFAPVVDGVLLPTTPLEAIRAGKVPAVPLLLGANRDEGRLFLLASEPPVPDEPALSAIFAAACGDGAGALETFRALDPGAGPVELVAALTGTQLFLAPTDRLAEAYAALTPDVWRYLFTWRSAARDGALGACHSLELPFVFDNLDRPGVRKFTGPNPPQALADGMAEAWAAFARHGAPPDWPRFDSGDRWTRLFDTT